MNLQQLEYLNTLSKVGNFTKAANILSISQPALSKSISKLEEELEVELFEKEGRNIKITKYGEEFIKYAESALNEISKGKDKLKDMKRINADVISIASTYCIGATFLPVIIGNIFNKELSIKFNINNEPSNDIIRDLKNGKIDFGFIECINDINDEEIEYKLVKKEEYVLIVSKNHPLANREEVSLAELRNENFILYNNKSFDKPIDYSKFIGFKPNVVMEHSEGSILAALVSTGAGISIILNTPMINTVKLSTIRIKENIGAKNIYMVWNKKINNSEIKKKFKEYILDLENIN